MVINQSLKGVMERLGLGPNVIFKENPKIIYARLTGYGQFGELSEKAGHDINYISYSGVLSTLGRQNEKPYAPINLVADFAGGGLMCALAIMTSLYERLATNKTGKVIDLSMVEGSAYVSSWLRTSRDLPGVWEGKERGESLLDGGYPAYETYETKDGKYMACGSLEPAFYKQLLKGLGLEKTDELSKEILENKFKTKTQSEWVEVFKNLDACVSPVLSQDEAPLHVHNRERNSFIKLPDGSFLPNMNWLDLKPSERSFKLPDVGEHTSVVLKDFGYSSLEIENYLKENVVEDCKLKSKL